MTKIEYYFFITKPWINQDPRMRMGYLFLPDGNVKKKRLHTSLFMFDRDRLKEYLLIKFTHFNYCSKIDQYGIFISNSDVVAIKQLYENDYNRFYQKYFRKTFENFEINPNLSLTEIIENVEEKERIDSIKEYYSDLGQKWDEEYAKNWIASDTKSNSDITDYDQDWNYIYEDNSNPTNSDFFNKSDSDFLKNN
jgi:hypothetical protein